MDASAVRHCKSIYDSHAAYYRIFAPDHSVAERLIYTDTDVLFFTDIERFFEEDLRGAAVGMRSGPTVARRDHAEKSMLLKYGKKESDLYFGSGLAVIDTALYRTQKIAEKCLEVIRDDSPSLQHSDQSVWNAAISQVCDIGQSYIHTAPPGGNKGLRGRYGIVHFVGSPKPWDLFCEFLHPHASLWYREAAAAGISFVKARRYLNGNFWARARRISRQYRALLRGRRIFP